MRISPHARRSQPPGRGGTAVSTAAGSPLCCTPAPCHEPAPCARMPWRRFLKLRSQPVTDSSGTPPPARLRRSPGHSPAFDGCRSICIRMLSVREHRRPAQNGNGSPSPALDEGLDQLSTWASIWNQPWSLARRTARSDKESPRLQYPREFREAGNTPAGPFALVASAV